MTPQPQPRDAFELFQSHFDQLLNESDESVLDRWVENPYWQCFCGYTLAATLETVESVTGVSVTDAYVDKGYRGHGCDRATRVHLAGTSSKNISRGERKRRRRRSAIEPKIGHLKSDHRMGRCFLAKLCGDAINAVLAAAGANLRKLLGLLRGGSRRLFFAPRYSCCRMLLIRIGRLIRLPEPRDGLVTSAC